MFRIKKERYSRSQSKPFFLPAQNESGLEPPHIFFSSTTYKIFSANFWVDHLSIRLTDSEKRLETAFLQPVSGFTIVSPPKKSDPVSESLFPTYLPTMNLVSQTTMLFGFFQCLEAILPNLIQKILFSLAFSLCNTFHCGRMV